MTTDQKLDLILDKVISIDERLGRVEERLDKVEERLEKVEERLDKMEERLDKMEERLDKMEERLDRVEERLDKMEERLDKMEERQEKLESELSAIRLHLENNTDRNIQLLAEAHSLFVSKYSKVEEISDKQYSYYVKVNYMAEKVENLEKELAELKKRIA